MKKLLLTIAIIFVFSIVTNAQSDGYFAKDSKSGNSYRETENVDVPIFPSSHGTTNSIDAPLGSGLLILTALGCSYALTRRKQ